MTVPSKTLAIFAAALIACGPAASAARSPWIMIPPPAPISKEAYPDTRVPKELLSRFDAANSAYHDCRFATEREAHRTGKTVAEFERIWARSCIPEEAELTRRSIAIRKFRGDPNPNATVLSESRERRAGVIESYRRFLKTEAELRELCGSDFRRCQD